MKEENLKGNGGGGKIETLEMVKVKRRELTERVVSQYHLNKFSGVFEKIINKFGEKQGLSLITRKFSKIFVSYREFYYLFGHDLIDMHDKDIAKNTQAAKKSSDIELAKKL